MPQDTILYQILLIIIAAIVSYWLAKSKDREKGENDELARVIKDIEQLKATAVSEQRVREIIKDAIEPTGHDVREIKSYMQEQGKTLQSIQLKLATVMAFHRGKTERDNDND